MKFITHTISTLNYLPYSRQYDNVVSVSSSGKHFGKTALCVFVCSFLFESLAKITQNNSPSKFLEKNQWTVYLPVFALWILLYIKIALFLWKMGMHYFHYFHYLAGNISSCMEDIGYSELTWPHPLLIYAFIHL